MTGASSPVAAAFGASRGGARLAQVVSKAFDTVNLDEGDPSGEGAPGVLVLNGGDAAAVATSASALDCQWAATELVLVDGPFASDELRARAQYVLRPDAGESEVLAIVNAVLELRRSQDALREEVATRRSAVGRIRWAEFEFRTLEEAKNLATMLSLACPDPEAAAVGLQEILANAVEHGSLGFDGEEKMALLIEGRWREALAERMAQAPYCNREVIVTFERTPDALEFWVRDEGGGFDAAAYAAPSPGGPRRVSGRGIWLARTIAFDRLEFLGRGNVARCVIALRPSANE